MTLKEQMTTEYVRNSAHILNTEKDIRQAFQAGWDAAINVNAITTKKD